MTGGKVQAMAKSSAGRVVVLHVGLIALMFLLQFVLPQYHHTNLARIMVLACYAIGYNLLLGYTGLLSLGHAMFFAVGLYATGLAVAQFGLDPLSGFLAGPLAGCALAVLVGLVALRTSGVAFMIVTLMFAQTGFLLILYFGDLTRGDEGFVVAEGLRRLAIGGMTIDLAAPAVRYNLALALFGACLFVSWAVVRSSIGRVFVAIRENEERTRLLGYDTWRYKLLALALSGTMSGAAGGAYALLFAYVGATFASIQYSIYPLLWVLLGGAGTTLGPFLGTLLMFYLIDIASGLLPGYLIVVGAVLILLTLWFPKGIMGSLRARWLTWLP
jgi:branched-chain amino acid transport system permease protein